MLRLRDERDRQERQANQKEAIAKPAQLKGQGIWGQTYRGRHVAIASESKKVLPHKLISENEHIFSQKWKAQ